ncbi:MAG: methyltransferase domain-containing protein [Caldilineaceae bacterium]|nr:methyltransferase domain-containing protein [Caldilineaceae bacterium]
MTTEPTPAPEPMAAFFDRRAAGYDAHMCSNVFTDATFVKFYRAIASPIPETVQPLQILDLGCGTGLEIEFLLQRAPHAQITAVDLSEGMLALLAERYHAQMPQITLVADSYLTMDLGAQRYDYILSAMTIHHLLHEPKRRLYAQIYAALKPGGRYIEGDTVTTAVHEADFLAEYAEEVAQVPSAEDGAYHIDVPFAIETQRELLSSVGFKEFTLLWQLDSSAEWNHAVYVVTKSK